MQATRRIAGIVLVLVLVKHVSAADLNYRDIRAIAERLQGSAAVIEPFVKPPTEGNVAHGIAAEVVFPAWDGEVSKYQSPIRCSILLNVYRTKLFKNPNNQREMESCYSQCETLIKDAVREINKQTGVKTDAQEDTQLEESVQAVVFEGIQHWASKRGWKFVWETKAIGPVTVKLLAVSGATIEVLPYTVFLICESCGTARDKMPWKSYSDGDDVEMIGRYKFRVFSQGSLIKDVLMEVSDKTKELKLVAK